MADVVLELPVDDPVDVPAVKLQLGIGDDEDDLELEPIVGAVNAVVRELPVADKSRSADPATGTWSPKVTHGATMLAARLYRRKGSPEGVASFGADGPVYVQRNDPDVAMLLELGAWSAPAVG